MTAVVSVSSDASVIISVTCGLVLFETGVGSRWIVLISAEISSCTSSTGGEMAEICCEMGGGVMVISARTRIPENAPRC